MTRTDHMPKGMTDRQIGWSVAAVNYSDIAAMGAEPIGIVVAFALPGSTQFHSLEEMMRGIEDCSRSVGAEVLGGDTKESPIEVITGTAIGRVEKDGILLRKGAREGDILAITGTMGLAAAGYHAIENGIRAPKAIKALMEPVPRVREGRTLSASGTVSACMDITDGLAFSVHQISEASGVGFELDWEAIPVDPEVLDVASATGEPLENYVLYYGGDYQLLFTISPEGLDLDRTIARRCHNPHRKGHCRRRKCINQRWPS